MSLAPLNPRAASSDLERVVRTFADTTSKPDRTRVSYGGGSFGGNPSTTADDDALVTLSWSARASVQILTMEGLGFTIEDDAYDELERTTHVERVENPDDSSQFVDVEVIDQIKFKKKQASSTYNLNN